MRTIIFSDTHLTEKFDPAKFNFLYDLCQNADKIIVNGDFWEGWYTDARRFVNSKWGVLFRLMKSKNAIFIYGNHDPERNSKEVAKYFSTEQHLFFNLKVGDKNLHIEHGHRLFPTVDHYLSEGVIEKFLRIPFRIWWFFEGWIYKLLGPKKADIGNKVILQNRDNYIKNKSILICGHTHASMFELDERYINSGFIMHGFASYIQIENDEIDLITKKY